MSGSKKVTTPPSTAPVAVLKLRPGYAGAQHAVVSARSTTPTNQLRATRSVRAKEVDDRGTADQLATGGVIAIPACKYRWHSMQALDTAMARRRRGLRTGWPMRSKPAAVAVHGGLACLHPLPFRAPQGFSASSWARVAGRMRRASRPGPRSGASQVRFVPEPCLVSESEDCTSRGCSERERRFCAQFVKLLSCQMPGIPLLAKGQPGLSPTSIAVGGPISGKFRHPDMEELRRVVCAVRNSLT